MDASQEQVDLVLLAGVSLAAGGLAVAAPWEVTAGAGLVMIIAFHGGRVRMGAVAVVALAMIVGLVRARTAVGLHERERESADAVFPQPERCSARGRVDSSPVRVRGSLRWDAHLSGLECDGAQVAWTGRTTLYGGPENLARGDEVDVVATLAPPQRLWNRATGDPRPSEALRNVVRTGGTLDVHVTRRASGPLAWIDRARALVRRRIDACFASDVAPMARALVLGESDLDPNDDQSFRASGLSHLLAVSGMHLVLVLGAVVRVFEGALVRVERVAARLDVGRLAAGIGIPIAWLYAELAGAGGSTLRAAWMATVGLAARALGRRTDATRAFGLSLGAMAIVEPLIAFDLSFALSAGATAGLLAFASPLGERLASRVHTRVAPTARAIATTIAASIPCVPILARFAPTFPLGGVVANLLAVPLGESIALPLCLVHALLSWYPAAERGCAIVASGALVLVRVIARVFAMPAVTAQVPQPTSWQLVAFVGMLAAVALKAKGRGLFVGLGAVALALLEVDARRAGAPHGVLRATFLDVGQGDGAIVDLPDGQALVVDGGGLVGSPIDVGARVLAPELRARRRSALLAAVLTHPHPDHFGGLVTGLDGVDVGAFWDTGQGEVEQVGGGYAALLQGLRGRGVAVLRPKELCGARVLGGARIEVLAPCPAPSSDSNPNNNSFVIRIAYGERTLLLVGDAEREEEDELLAAAEGDLHADVLKVGHHGSATSSSPAFLEAVAPGQAIISVGRRNRFGHPSSHTLAALAAAGARVWRTDRDGAVTVTTDGHALDVHSLAPSP
jgi:competence protein ComEC